MDPAAYGDNVPVYVFFRVENSSLILYSSKCVILLFHPYLLSLDFFQEL